MDCSTDCKNCSAFWQCPQLPSLVPFGRAVPDLLCRDRVEECLREGECAECCGDLALAARVALLLGNPAFPVSTRRSLCRTGISPDDYGPAIYSCVRRCPGVRHCIEIARAWTRWLWLESDVGPQSSGCEYVCAPPAQLLEAEWREIASRLIGCKDCKQPRCWWYKLIALVAFQKFLDDANARQLARR